MVSGTITVNRANTGQSIYPFNGTSDGSRCAVIVPAFTRRGFCKSLASLNNFSFPYLEKCIGRSLTNDGIFSKRYFSDAQKVANKNDTVNTLDGKHVKSALGFTCSNKHKKQARTFVVHGKDRNVTSSTSASEDVDVVTSRKSLVEDKGLLTSTPPVNNNKQDSKLTARKKKSESKNNKNSTSTSSEQVAGAQCSVYHSAANTSDTIDIGQSSSHILKVGKLYFAIRK